jgi:hypothetical protein
MKTKKCNCCKEHLPLNKFQTAYWSADGYHTTCMTCMAMKAKEGKRKAKEEREKEKGQGHLPFIESDPIEALFDQEIETLQKQVRTLRDKKKRFKAGKMKVTLENGKVVLY